jgi:hypothetical protein
VFEIVNVHFNLKIVGFGLVFEKDNRLKTTEEVIMNRAAQSPIPETLRSDKAHQILGRNSPPSNPPSAPQTVREVVEESPQFCAIQPPKPVHFIQAIEDMGTTSGVITPSSITATPTWYNIALVAVMPVGLVLGACLVWFLAR